MPLVFIPAPRLSLATVSGGHSLVVVLGLLSAEASHCGERALGCTGLVTVVHRISCSAACGNFLDQGIEPMSSHVKYERKSQDEKTERHSVCAGALLEKIYWRARGL